MITWEQLTAGEQRDLTAIANGEFDDNEDYGDDKFTAYTSLWNKGLISRKYEHTFVTDAGRVLLAQAPTAQPEAEGEARVIKRLKELRHEYHYGNLTDYGKDNLIALAGEMLLRGDTSLQSLIDTQTQLAASLEREKALREALKPFGQTWMNYITDSMGENFLQWYFDESDEETVMDMHKQAAEALAAVIGGLRGAG